MKKVYFLFNFLLLSLAVNAYDLYYDGIFYNFTSSSEVEVTYQYGDVGTYKDDVTIPESIEYNGKTYQVTSIGKRAFFRSEKLWSVIMSNNIKKLGVGAFRSCVNLKTVKLSNNIESIGDETFAYCKNLTSLNLPEELLSIGQTVFLNCSSLITLSLPQSLNSIGRTAFWNCSNLKSINIPGNVKELDYSVFDGCENLNEVIIEDGMEPLTFTSWRDISWAFKTSPIKTLYLGRNIICEEVEPIYGFYTRSPFNNATTLTSLTIGEKVTELCDYEFCGSGLKKLIIPKTLVKFGENVFLGCNQLKEIIYLPTTAPINWTATTKTYVPDEQAYSSPEYSINDAHIIEMITFNSTEFEYNELLGKSPTTTWTNNISDYTASLSMPTLNGEIGNHEEWIPVSFTKGDESFTTSVVYRYVVKPVKLIAKVLNVSREYGEENPQFSITYSGFINGEDESVITTQPTISTTATKTSNVGDYPITCSGGSAQKYELVYEPGVLTITKAPLSAKINDATKVYGSQNPAFTINYYGLKNDETTPAWSTSPTFVTDATSSSSVGQYEVKVVNGVTVNYDLGDITEGILTITPALLTIKANDATRQYYSDEPNFGYTCNGFLNGDNENTLSPEPTLATTANLSSNVGTYPIKASGASNSNYTISYIDGTLTITPRSLYASVGNYERLYNEDNPAFEVKYDGFVGNEGENVLISKATASTTATKISDVGSYPINVTGGSADNYKFSYTSGTLTINKAEQTISWDQDLSNLKVGDQVELQAIASSGLSITYSMESNNFAEIYTAGNNKKYLDCKAEGQFTIRATQDGNKNYYSSTRINKTVTIGNGESAVKSVDNSVIEIQRMPSGIRVINAQFGDVIRLYSTDGILHKFVKVEGQLTDIPLSKDKIYIVKIGGKTVKIGL